jgi:3-isopropylmalate/(R)-2-methylmalate dehydratase small subunit
MKKFTNFESVIAYLPITNIDTDMIIPKDFLKTLKRTGLGKNLFYEMRYDNNGNQISDFVLNKPEFKNAQIVFGGDNFGCGSSREHAPWALADFGIKCVISTSFADIFYNNCFKNAILPAIIDKSDHHKINEILQGSNKPVVASVDITNKKLTINGESFAIKIDDARQAVLIEGLDDIAQTLHYSSAIDTFEKNDKRYWIRRA